MRGSSAYYYLEKSAEPCCNASQLSCEPIVVTYQKKPRRRSHFRSRSPTESLQSRQRWSFHELTALAAVHSERPPIFFATLKWQTTVTPGEIKTFEKNAFDAIRRFSRQWKHELRLYLVHEIDRTGLVHAHCLIRTDLDRQRCYLFLAETIGRLSNGAVSLPYFEPVQCEMAVSRYTVKNTRGAIRGKKEVLLFEPGLLRIRKHLGYFDGHKMAEWREAGRQLLLPHNRNSRIAPDEVLTDPWSAQLFGLAQAVSV